MVSVATAENPLFPSGSLYFFIDQKQTLFHNLTFFSTSKMTPPGKTLTGIVTVGEPSSSCTNVISWLDGHLSMVGHKYFGVGVRHPDIIQEEQALARQQEEELYGSGVPEASYFDDELELRDIEENIVARKDVAASSPAAVIFIGSKSPEHLESVVADLPSPIKSKREPVAPSLSHAPRVMSLGPRNSYIEVAECEYAGDIGNIGKFGPKTDLETKSLKCQIVEEAVYFGERADIDWFSYRVRANKQELNILTHSTDNDPRHFTNRVKLQAIMVALWKSFVSELDRALEGLYYHRKRDHQIPDFQILREFAGRVGYLTFFHPFMCLLNEQCVFHNPLIVTPFRPETRAVHITNCWGLFIEEGDGLKDAIVEAEVGNLRSKMRLINREWMRVVPSILKTKTTHTTGRITWSRMREDP